MVLLARAVLVAAGSVARSLHRAFFSCAFTGVGVCARALFRVNGFGCFFCFFACRQLRIFFKLCP